MPEDGPNGKSDRNFVKTSAVTTGASVVCASAAAGATGGGDLRRPGPVGGAGDLRPLGDGTGDLLRPRALAPGNGTCNDTVLAGDAGAGGGKRFSGAVVNGRVAELAAGTAIDKCCKDCSSVVVDEAEVMRNRAVEGTVRCSIFIENREEN